MPRAAESTNVNNNGGAEASVVFPPRFSFSVNQNYSRKEFKERTTDSAAASVASSTVTIQLQGIKESLLGEREDDESRRRHHVVFISYLGLNQILGRKEKKSIDPSSSVISVTAVVTSTKGEAGGRSRQTLSGDHRYAGGIQVRLQLPEERSKELECYSWPSSNNNIDDGRCHVARWHNGSAECVCDALTRYALNVTDIDVIIAREEEKLPTILKDHSLLFGLGTEKEDTTTMVVIVAVSSTLLVATILSAALLVIYCRRVKVCWQLCRSISFSDQKLKRLDICWKLDRVFKKYSVNLCLAFGGAATTKKCILESGVCFRGSRFNLWGRRDDDPFYTALAFQFPPPSSWMVVVVESQTASTFSVQIENGRNSECLSHFLYFVFCYFFYSAELRTQLSFVNVLFSRRVISVIFSALPDIW